MLFGPVPRGHAVLAQVAGQVAGGGLEGGLGHAHPVIVRPRLGGVEVEPDDGPAAGGLEQGQAGHGQGLQ